MPSRRTLTATERAIEQRLRELGFRGSRFGLYRDRKRPRSVDDVAQLVRLRFDRELETVDYRVYARGLLRQRIELTFAEALSDQVTDWLEKRLRGVVERSPVPMAADFATNTDVWSTTISAAAAMRRGTYDRLRDEFLWCGCAPCRRNVIRLPEQHAEVRVQVGRGSKK